MRDKTEFDKYTEKGEDGLTAQEFLNKSAECAMNAVENTVYGHLLLMRRLLNLASIKELLPTKESQLQFAWYVAMLELTK